MDEVLAVLRVYSDGKRWREFQSGQQAYIKSLNEDIKFYRILKGYLDHQYDDVIRPRVRKLFMKKYMTESKMAVFSLLPTAYKFYRQLRRNK